MRVAAMDSKPEAINPDCCTHTVVLLGRLTGRWLRLQARAIYGNNELSPEQGVNGSRPSSWNSSPAGIEYLPVSIKCKMAIRASRASYNALTSCCCDQGLPSGS